MDSPGSKNKSVSMCQFVVEGYSLWWRKMASKFYFCASSARSLSLDQAPIEYPIEVRKDGCHEGLL
jgi:hypothetical protein